MSSNQITRAHIRKHIEQTLGTISAEWEEQTDGGGLPFSIVRVDDQPSIGAFSLVTIGLSALDLRFPSGKHARQELVIACRSSYKAGNVQGLLAAIALDCSERQRAFARGDVEGPAGPLLDAVRTQALYASLPAYFPDSFAVSRDTDPSTHFLWMVPITAIEAAFVTREGWSRFEDLLEAQDPDLLDFDRDSIDLPPAPD